LFASVGHDLRSLVRGQTSDTLLTSAIAQIWQGRGDRYSATRSQATLAALDAPNGPQRVEMSYIGG
jgi:cyclic pyranopterin phosphate synthase